MLEEAESTTTDHELDADIDADLERILADMGTDDETPADDAVSEGDTNDKEDADRKRDEQGRFTKQNDKEEAPTDGRVEQEDARGEAKKAQEDGADSTAKELDDQGTNLSGAPETNVPPVSWRAEAKSKWVGIDPAVREEIIRREAASQAGFEKGIAQYKDQADYGGKLNQVIQPYSQMISEAGSTPEQLVSELLTTVHHLRTSTPQLKGQIVMQIAQQYGADMTAYLGKQAASAPTPGSNDTSSIAPAIDTAMSQRLQAIEQSIQDTKKQELALQQQNIQIEEQNASQSITKFQNEVNDQGQLKHLYFENVKADMAGLLEMAHHRNQKLDLEGAYQQAIWANPETRAILQAEQTTQEIAKQKEAAIQAAKEAKIGGSTNLPAKGAPATVGKEQIGTIDETMRETLRRIQGSV